MSAQINLLPITPEVLHALGKWLSTKRPTSKDNLLAFSRAPYSHLHNNKLQSQGSHKEKSHDEQLHAGNSKIASSGTCRSVIFHELRVNLWINCIPTISTWMRPVEILQSASETRTQVAVVLFLYKVFSSTVFFREQKIIDGTHDSLQIEEEKIPRAKGPDFLC